MGNSASTLDMLRPLQVRPRSHVLVYRLTVPDCVAVGRCQGPLYINGCPRASMPAGHATLPFPLPKFFCIESKILIGLM